MRMSALNETPTTSSLYNVQVVHPTISGTNVTVQAVGAGQRLSIPRRALAPLLSSPPPVQMISKVLLKCVSKEDKKVFKTFTIRNINPSVIKTCLSLKSLIKAQLGEDILKDFDIGYLHGNSVVNVRNSDDLQEVWSNVLKGTKVTLWCNGLNIPVHGGDLEDDVAPKPKKKRKRSDIDDTNQAVEDTVKELKQLHSGGYTPMQYRIWAEMVHGGLHSSMEEPPTSTMFVRCGKGKSKQKSGSDDTLSNAISQLASALSPPAGRVSTPIGIGTSPAKLIDSRSKCYKQLSDLNNLVYWMTKSTWKRGKL